MIFTAIISLIYVLYGDRQNWSVVTLLWVASICTALLTRWDISLENFLMITLFFMTFMPGIYYRHYFSQKDAIEKKKKRFLSLVTVGAILILSGVMVISYQVNIDTISELLSEDRLRPTNVFQFIKHYEVWGVVLGAFVILLFSLVTEVKSEGENKK